jgi:ATP-dependent helicase HrpB
VTAALSHTTTAVLVAPPVLARRPLPLVLMQEPRVADRCILVLKPRRLATRMAQTLSEKVGDTVGYRMRFGTQVSRRTRIEVITERLHPSHPG